MGTSKSLKRSAATAAVLATVSFAAMSCGKSSDSSTTSSVTATNVADLKLSSSLHITLPDSLAKVAGQSNSPGLALTMAGKKSTEACQTVQNVARMFDRLTDISNAFCHLEVESANIKFGTKYKIVLLTATGPMELPSWIDNSTPGQLTMYQCYDGKIRQKVVLTSSTASGVKGNLWYKDSNNGNFVTDALDFDFTNDGVKIVKGQNHFSDGTNSYAQDNALEFRDVGVSLMKTASRGRWGSNNSFQDRGLVKSNGTLGQALFKGQGTSDYGTYSGSSRSTFDQDGIAVANATATSDITVAAGDLPAFLADDFAIPDATGWDCPTEEMLTIDLNVGPNAAAHAACDRMPPQFVDCWSSDYEQGDQEQID